MVSAWGSGIKESFCLGLPRKPGRNTVPVIPVGIFLKVYKLKSP